MHCTVRIAKGVWRAGIFDASFRPSTEAKPCGLLNQVHPHVPHLDEQGAPLCSASFLSACHTCGKQVAAMRALLPVRRASKKADCPANGSQGNRALKGAVPAPVAKRWHAVAGQSTEAKMKDGGRREACMEAQALQDPGSRCVCSEGAFITSYQPISLSLDLGGIVGGSWESSAT